MIDRGLQRKKEYKNFDISDLESYIFRIKKVWK